MQTRNGKRGCTALPYPVGFSIFQTVKHLTKPDIQKGKNWAIFGHNSGNPGSKAVSTAALPYFLQQIHPYSKALHSIQDMGLFNIFSFCTNTRRMVYTLCFVLYKTMAK